MKRFLLTGAMSLLSAVALTTDLMEIPGKYNFETIIWIATLCIFYSMIGKRVGKKDPVLLIPAGLASLFRLLGETYYRTNTSSLLWGSKLRIVWFFICFTGLMIFFFHLFVLVTEGFKWLSALRVSGTLKQTDEGKPETVDVSKAETADGSKVEMNDKISAGRKFALTLDRILFGKYCLPVMSGLIYLSWLPILLISYPGGCCGDASYQISQALGMNRFNTGHPLLHTLFLGFFMKVGKNILGSYNRGLFLQILVQSVIMAHALGLSIAVLNKMKTKKGYLLLLLLIYCFAPFYSNFATMTIKDSLFNTWILLYFIMMVLFLYKDHAQIKPYTAVPCVIFAVLVMMFRNNGLIVVASTGFGLIVYLAIRYFKTRKGNPDKMKTLRRSFLAAGIYVLLPIALFFVLDKTLTVTLHADTYNGKEVLSIPFQQTARYIKSYDYDITDSEWEAIDKVLTGREELGTIYDPNISDPLKRQFVETATTKDIMEYLKVWVRLFFRHPGPYFDAFFNLCYGWFDVGLDNAIRYDGMSDLFYPPRWGDTKPLVQNWFAVMNGIPVLGMLQNVGVYTWWLVLLSMYLFQKKRFGKWMIFLLPLYMSLLVCVASPACLLHPRYAFPILFTLPFLTGALIEVNEKHNSTTNL